jgi:hypothetical protein
MIAHAWSKRVLEYTLSLCSSKTRKIQVDLFGAELSSNEWTKLGFISTSFWSQ